MICCSHEHSHLLVDCFLNTIKSPFLSFASCDASCLSLSFPVHSRVLLLFIHFHVDDFSRHETNSNICLFLLGSSYHDHFPFYSLCFSVRYICACEFIVVHLNKPNYLLRHLLSFYLEIKKLFQVKSIVFLPRLFYLSLTLTHSSRAHASVFYAFHCSQIQLVTFLYFSYMVIKINFLVTICY